MFSSVKKTKTVGFLWSTPDWMLLHCAHSTRIAVAMQSCMAKCDQTGLSKRIAQFRLVSSLT